MRQPSLAEGFLQNFLGDSPLWYKHTIMAFLLVNPVVLALNSYVAGWLLLCEFLFTLVMSMRCYPLQPGGLLAIQAVAIRGTKGVAGIKDFCAFLKATNDAKKVLADNAVTGQGLPKYGTQVLMNVINEIGALPTRNHRDVQFEDASKISAEAMHEKRESDGKTHLVTNAACFGCTIACGRISEIDKTHFTVKNSPKYWGASGGLEYEAAWALGAANGVGDLEALQYANLICNEQGMDPISFGATVGAAMELYELGILLAQYMTRGRSVAAAGDEAPPHGE